MALIDKHSINSGYSLLLLGSFLTLVLSLMTSFEGVESGQRFTLRDSLVNTTGSMTQSTVARTPHQASLDLETCATYDRVAHSIIVTCQNASLTDVGKVFNESSFLKNEGSGVWFLNSNLTVAEGANFTIDSTWLKINSTTSENAYHIEVAGNLNVHSSRISSWNSTSSNYAETDGNIHRASVVVLSKSTGTAYISDSELAYLGYDASPYQGLSYYGGDGAIIKNNTIHNMWYGFHSNGRANIIIDDNHVHGNLMYGLHPRVGTHDMIIRNNIIHDNNGLGVACSLNCNNVTIESNDIYGNNEGGVLLTRNAINSIVKNNSIHDELKGLILSKSNNNKAYDNRISGTDVSIEIKDGSSENSIFDNQLENSSSYGINIVKQASQNKVDNNIISNSGKYGICVRNNSNNNTIINNTIVESERDGICLSNRSSGNLVKLNLINGSMRNGIRVAGNDSINNTFGSNEIHRANVGILTDNNTGSLFFQNNIGDSKESEYSVSRSGYLKLQRTNFSSDNITATGRNESLVSIEDSGIILVTNSSGNNETTINSNENPYLARLLDSESITIRTGR